MSKKKGFQKQWMWEIETAAELIMNNTQAGVGAHRRHIVQPFCFGMGVNRHKPGYMIATFQGSKLF